MIAHLSSFCNRLLAICILAGCCSYSSLSAGEYNIIPYPRTLIPQSGSFTFTKRTTVYCPFDQPEVLKLAQQFSEHFELVTGVKLQVRDIANAKADNALIFQPELNLENAEAYRLSVSSKTIRIKAAAANGFFYGLQTLYQLLPAEIYGKKLVENKKWSARAVEIMDAPRFAYRGLHLDVCRHFFPVEFVKKYIDAMAIHKFNTFHWHLTEDQGWRIEIKKYPRLTEVGSKRDETMVGYYYDRLPQAYDGKPTGGYYTQAEAREIVAYAKERFITVIPEIELPGHAQAAIAAYPYLSCMQDSTVKVATKWGVFKEVYCPRDTTFKFLEDVLTEVLDIFPSKYIHIGGDECPKDRWKTCLDCQALIKSLNLKDENGLQSYFVHRIERFLNSKGRKIIGWDEILDGGLDPNATVMSWRGTQGGITAAKAGNDVIMTPGSYCYFDHYQSDPVAEPLSIGGFLPLQMVYGYEPVPAELSDDEAKHVLGAQANVWTEYMPATESVEYMVFPRLSAMAEVLWSAKNNRNWDSFRNRMPSQFKRYEQLDIKASKAFYDVQFHPSITADKKLQVTLSCDCPDAQISYTINGKSTGYKNPFILAESTEVTAIALVDGKQLGKSITKPYQVSKLTGLAYTQSMKSGWYDGGNARALTDGVPGNNKDYGQWVGFGKGKDVELVVDMQSAQKIERFAVGMLNAPALCAQISPDIKLYGSTDGVNYQLLAEKQLTAPTAPDKVIVRPELTFPAAEVRYLKVQLKNANYCPANKLEGTECGVMFLDEIGAW
ncbi:MAG TPA: glycoside hydrolase family 20 protein [Paludibacter sp.]|nr:glycoside hydrolase family 20 protein [Paludibacter sp.]